MNATDTEYLRFQKLCRSAYAVTTATATAIYLGTCDTHQRPVRADLTDNDRPRGGWPQKLVIDCPEGDTLTGERLHAVTTKVECDGACMSARRKGCSCGCGGVNHGRMWGGGMLISSARVVEAELAKYRAKAAKVTAARQQRREAEQRREGNAFTRWAEANASLVEALAAYRDADCPNSFLHDLAVQVIGGWNGRPKPLTDNQARAARQSIERDRQRQARQAAHDAEIAARKANARPAPTGKVRVDGEIVKVTVRPGYAYNTLDVRAIVACDGYAVQVTVPAAILREAREGNRVLKANPDRPTVDEHDYDGMGIRWTRTLRGTRLAFTAEVKRSEKDESFGFAKRPAKVTYTIPPLAS